MNENQNVQECLNISLVIDESNITHIDIDTKKAENVAFIIGKVCKKYNLDDKVKEKLGKEINKRIDNILEKKGNGKKTKTENTINRLYYEAVEKNKEKEAFLDKIRNEQENEVLNSLTFTPCISKNSNLLYVKTHLKIEDKLYNEFKEINERKNYTRLITEISQRSKSRKAKSKHKNTNFNNNDDCKFNNTLEVFDHHHKSKLVRKNSGTIFNFKENKGNLPIYKNLEQKYQENDKHLIEKESDKPLNLNEKETDKQLNEKVNFAFNTYNPTEINSNLNLVEVSQINKNRNFNTDESFDDSYMNLNSLQSKYKLEEKSYTAAIKNLTDNKENESKATGTNKGYNYKDELFIHFINNIKKFNFVYEILQIN